jgi:hypothetical protein
MAQLLYAAPGQLVCITSGEGEYDYGDLFILIHLLTHLIEHARESKAEGPRVHARPEEDELPYVVAGPAILEKVIEVLGPHGDLPTHALRGPGTHTTNP